jgi:hypothetical protein
MEHRFGNGRRGGKKYFLFPLVAIAFVALGGLVVMLLWNNIIPLVIPSVRKLNYGQAVGLLVLSRILFGGFKGRPGGGFGPGRGFGPGGMRRGGPDWREKMHNMTDEERAKFREEWRERCRRKREF